MNLVIVESPTKARTLSKFLGSGYSIKASMGHVRDLPKSELGVDVEHKFSPQYVVVEGREGVIEGLKAEAKGARQVILATDPDREGEAIAYHVMHMIGENQKSKIKNQKFSRIVFHEITKSAVEEALAHPGKIKMDLVHAQQGRRVLDRLVGYKLSPLLWRKVRRGLSAGRVQSVAVRMIVEREKEIEAFKAQEYWDIQVEVRKVREVQEVSRVSDSFIVNLVAIDDKRAAKDDFLVKTKDKAGAIVEDLEKAKYAVVRVETKEVKQSPPPPFMTSTLQRRAATLFGWSGRKTMRAAQRLYEGGYITYHRTDSLNIAEAALAQAAKFVKEKYGDKYMVERPRRYKSTSKLAQEAHEAIRPTDVYRENVKEGTKQTIDSVRLYRMIWQRFVASQMAVAVYDRTTIDVTANSQQPTANSYLLRAVGRVMKFEGWQALYSASEKLKTKSEKVQLKSQNFTEDSEEQRLPELAEGESLLKKKVLSEQKFTEPPPRFNEASLIKALEERGIGRPSTYAPTISTIQTRQYVEKKENRFYPTEVGITVTEFLLKYFPQIMDYDFTAEMEGDLDKIAEGKRKWVQVIKEFYGPFEKIVIKTTETAKRMKVEAEKTGDKCPECKQGDVVIRIGRFGKFLSCSRFPECKYTQNYVEKVEGVKCPDDGGEIVVRRTRKGKQFYGCSNFPKCKWASWRRPSQLKTGT